MSYGPQQRPQLSACASEFLSVHPYFNSDSSLKKKRLAGVLSFHHRSDFAAGISGRINQRLRPTQGQRCKRASSGAPDRRGKGIGRSRWRHAVDWTARKTQSSNSRGAVRNISYLTQPALCAARTRSISASRSCAAENSGWSLRSCSKTAAALLTYPNSRWSTPKL